MEFIFRHLVFSPTGLWSAFERKARRGYEFVMYSSLFVAIAATGMVYTSYGIEGTPPAAGGIAIMFLVAFSVYNLNRRTDEAEDALNHGGRFAFTKRYGRELITAAASCYIAAAVIAFSSGFTVLTVALVPLAAGILYSVPWIPPGFGYRRLKEIPVVKNLVVATAWAIPLSLLPALTGPPPGNGRVALSFLFFASYVFTASTIPDIRDREGDARTGVRTIPVLLGIRNTKVILTGINSIAGGAAVLAGTRVLSPAYILLIAAGVVYIHLSINSFYFVECRDVVCDLLSDGQFIIFGAATWAIGQVPA